MKLNLIPVAAGSLFAGIALAAPAASPPTDGMTLEQFIARQEPRLMAKDADGDGRISLVEFEATTASGKGDPSRRFARIDTNHDGFVDKAEIEAMLATRFHKLDADHDGVVTPAERQAARGKAGEPGE